MHGTIVPMTDESDNAPPDLGSLEVMDPRSVWAHEARDFTPWLFANADRLAEKLGIEIELEAMEQPVGGSFLDLLGRDQSHGVVLIVENQLTESDHVHLGQLLTYAAGTGASTIVWITTRVRDEHRQALTWLNEHTDIDTAFFGIELRLVRIGDSLPAPDFDVVVMPNDWLTSVRRMTGAGADGGAKGERYREFWAKLLDRVQREHPDWTRASPPAQNWLWMPSPIRGCGANAVFGHHDIRVELYIDRPSVADCEAVFDALYEQRAAFEATYGRSLEWNRMANRKACKVAESAVGDVVEIDEHDRYVAWFVDGLERMRRAVLAVGGQSL